MKENAKAPTVAVLFVLIGWAQRYDGTELVQGGHRYLQGNHEDSTETQAFIRDNTGYCRCGIDRGNVNEPSLDVVFVARHPKRSKYQVVGFYIDVEVTEGSKWSTVRTREAVLIPPESRPIIRNYPTGQGMRRWARRVSTKGQAEHSSLLNIYKKIKKIDNWDSTDLTEDELEVTAFEGTLRKQFIMHRRREAKLRSAKIRDVIRKTGGVLKCEVPGCGFDFYEVYGEAGKNFAVVHHLSPLAKSSPSGKKYSLDDIAIVCSNCHAIIHRGGQCRSLESIIKDQGKGS